MSFSYYDDPTAETKNKSRVFCPICGKPPNEPATCPGCGVANICGYHLYKFIANSDNSPVGCPKCGPKCSICGVQTPLIETGGRRVCSKCLQVVEQAESYNKNKATELVAKVKQALATIIPLAGIGAGIIMGMKPEYQDLVTELVKTELHSIVIIALWAFAGLIVGSIVSSIVNGIIK